MQVREDYGAAFRHSGPGSISVTNAHSAPAVLEAQARAEKEGAVALAKIELMKSVYAGQEQVRGLLVSQAIHGGAQHGQHGAILSALTELYPNTTIPTASRPATAFASASAPGCVQQQQASLQTLATTAQAPMGLLALESMAPVPPKPALMAADSTKTMEVQLNELRSQQHSITTEEYEQQKQRILSSFGF